MPNLITIARILKNLMRADFLFSQKIVRTENQLRRCCCGSNFIIVKMPVASCTEQHKLNGYDAKWLIKEFPIKGWKILSLNNLLSKTHWRPDDQAAADHVLFTPTAKSMSV